MTVSVHLDGRRDARRFSDADDDRREAVLAGIALE
jgi:hypothetical protein